MRRSHTTRAHVSMLDTLHGYGPGDMDDQLARTILERGGGYVWRGGKAFDLMKQDDETKAEWARYLTLNERARRAYDDLRSREMKVPAPLPNAPADYELRRQRIAEVEAARLSA